MSVEEPSPPTYEELVQREKVQLDDHIKKTKPHHDGPSVCFFVEKSSRPVICRHPVCEATIKGNYYRIAVCPGNFNKSNVAGRFLMGSC